MIDKNILRIMTCGSVDDGKSTLIGRLLFETESIYEDQMSALVEDSKKYGTQGDKLDYALLLDGLSAEREQGITIDVSYRYFATETRKFIIADSPGHEEYTRNMATAASQADLAILLVNAKDGIQPQTIRHAAILSMVGIKDIIMVVNKMDQVSYKQSFFENIKNDFKEKTTNMNFESVQSVPLSALESENLVHSSDKMQWFNGPDLLSSLHKFQKRENLNPAVLFPIQSVFRPSSEFRGYAGRLRAGTAFVGQNLISAQSGEGVKIAKILNGFKNENSASNGDSIVISLDREIDLSRGDVLLSNLNDVHTSHHFESRLFWFGKEDGHRGRSYLIKLGHQEATCTLVSLKSNFNLEKLSEEKCKKIQTNDIVKVDISTIKPLVFTPYSENKFLGSFILIDKMTHETVAAGMIQHNLRRGENVQPQHLALNRKNREQLNGHKAKVLWMTGLSGSGKSTIANALELKLHQLGYRTFILDGDNIRLGLNKDLGFTDADRVENIRRVSEVAKLMSEAGLVVITSFISPFAKDREMAKELIGEDLFNEIYISTPIEVCEKRDVKGLYKKARNGQIPNFSGISSLYEEPINPLIKVDTSNQSLNDTVETIISKLFQDK